jgi:pyridoxine 5-phosphate synthase
MDGIGLRALCEVDPRIAAGLMKATAKAAMERLNDTRVQLAADRAHAAGLIVNAGHGLSMDNVVPIAAVPVVHELNIGHAIVADALFVGLEEAVRRMRARMLAARAADRGPTV